MVFVIHWHESAMDLHLFPILIPPPASLSTRSLWVFPVHQGRALETDHQPRLDAWDKCSGPGNAWKNKEVLLNPRETQGHWLPRLGFLPYLIFLFVLQYGLQEGPPLVAGRLLIKHARLDHLLIHIQLVLGGGEDLLLHAVDGAEPQHTDLVLLADAVSAVLRLQVLLVRTTCLRASASGWAAASPTQEGTREALLNPPLLSKILLAFVKYTSYLPLKNSRSLLAEGTWVQIAQANWNTSQVLKSRSQDVFFVVVVCF